MIGVFGQMASVQLQAGSTFDIINGAFPVLVNSNTTSTGLPCGISPKLYDSIVQVMTGAFNSLALSFLLVGSPPHCANETNGSTLANAKTKSNRFIIIRIYLLDKERNKNVTFKRENSKKLASI